MDFFTYEALWKKMQERGVSVEEVAKTTGLNPDAFDLLHTGATMSEHMKKTLCSYFKCKIEEIVDKKHIVVRLIPKEEENAASVASLMKIISGRLRIKFYDEDSFSFADEKGNVSEKGSKKDLHLVGCFYDGNLKEIVDAVYTVVNRSDLKDKLSVVVREADNLEKEQEEDPFRGEGHSSELAERFKRLAAAQKAKLAQMSREEAADPLKEMPTPEERAAAERKSKIDRLNAEIDQLVGAKEFRSLCKEIISIAPQFKRKEERKIFLAQSYLFSVGSGDGLSTALSVLARVLNDTGLLSVGEDDFEEVVVRRPVKLEAIEASLDEIIEDAFGSRSVRGMMRKDDLSAKIVCLDISDWIDHIGNAQFKDFLRKVASKQDRFVVAFRIPFVDKEVLYKVREALNDAFYVRTVVFPPLSTEDYCKLAAIETEKYGFNLAKGAWPQIERRLAAEKSDGTFYGIKTLKKVVYELLYKKILSNAARENATYTIGARDAMQLNVFSEEDAMNAEEMMNSLVGMQDVKKQLKEILTQIEFSHENEEMTAPTIHMRFVGNPGTGKTTVARILGKVLKEKGILRIGNFFEYGGRDFCGRYVGETAPKTQTMCRDAYGSVLFIDEAYALYKGDPDSRDFGREALDTLIAEMENHREDLLVIMAGYPDEMDILMKGNAGLRSRMPYTITFKNFSREELYQIFVGLLKKSFDYDEDVLTEAKAYFDGLSDEFIEAKEFSNGRFVRNLFERTWAKAAMRRDLVSGKLRIIKEDFLRSITDDDFKKDLAEGRKTKRIGFGGAKG